jgi:hypothetical protein
MNLTCADCDNFAKSIICAGCTHYSLFVEYEPPKVLVSPTKLVSDLTNGIHPVPGEFYLTRPETGRKFDSEKLDWTLMPWKELEQTLEVLEFGAKKYSRDNWKHVEPARYEKAAMRHLISYVTGEKIDPESGKSHLAHLICNALFLMWNDNDKVS